MDETREGFEMIPEKDFLMGVPTQSQGSGGAPEDHTGGQGAFLRCGQLSELVYEGAGVCRSHAHTHPYTRAHMYKHMYTHAHTRAHTHTHRGGRS